ncbi:MAG: hypothetical protein AAF985_25570 [Bacteroidota bacterium]
MTRPKRTSTILFLLCTGMLFLFSTCKKMFDRVAYDTVHDINSVDSLGTRMDSLTRHADQLMRNYTYPESVAEALVAGAFKGLAGEETKAGMDSLTNRISSGIQKYLNTALADLAVDTLGANLIKGVVDRLDEPQTRDTLQKIISTAFGDVDLQIKMTLTKFFDQLASKDSQRQLEQLLLGAISEEGADSLQHFLNKTLNGISFAAIGDSLRQNVLNEATRDALDRTVPQLNSIVETVDRIADLFENTQNNWKRDAIFLSILALIAALTFYAIRQFFLKRDQQRKDEKDMNDVIMAAIHRMRAGDGVEELKIDIMSTAIEKGIQEELNEKLHRLGIRTLS